MEPRVSTLPTDAFEQFSHHLRSTGVRDALSYLLHLTDYRFIGIFRFRDGLATAVVYVDREQPDQTRAAEIPDSATYCYQVRANGEAFSTADALADPRLLDHAARAQVLAYTGVPVMDREGVLLGVLCLYDVVPRDMGQIDLSLLLEVSSALSYGGHVPPYPEPVWPILP